MHNEVNHSQSCPTIAKLLSRNCKKRIKEEAVPDYEFHADNLGFPSNERHFSRLVHLTMLITTPYQQQPMFCSMEPVSA